MNAAHVQHPMLGKNDTASRVRAYAGCIQGINDSETGLDAASQSRVCDQSMHRIKCKYSGRQSGLSRLAARFFHAITHALVHVAILDGGVKNRGSMGSDDRARMQWDTVTALRIPVVHAMLTTLDFAAW